MKRPIALAAGLAALAALGPAGSEPVGAQASYERISGAGSTWSANAIDAMRVNVEQFGLSVDYDAVGSSAGRKLWLNGTVDFAASDIPFQFEPEDGSPPDDPEPGSYAYIPVTAGGTAFMYNLKINGQRVTNLRLSGENVAKIFTGLITRWNDPALVADNPGLALPARQIVPVVRSDGSGSTAQFTTWMIARHGAIWQDYCERSGRAPACGLTSQYPTIPGMIAQSGDPGVAGYVSQGFGEGSIGYVNYSYALGVDFPVAKVLNAAGYYTEPTPENVAVSLLRAEVNTNRNDLRVYLTQELDGVYTDTDPRNYQLSSYSYFILPTRVQGNFSEGRGRSLAAFAYYAMCQAQQQSASLGYSPIPYNLVEAAFEQIRLIPGAVVQDIDIRQCRNPTFSPDHPNLLAAEAPHPRECDRQGPTQCATGTGGQRDVETPVSGGGGGDGGGGSVSGAGGGSGGAGTGGSDGSGTGGSGGAGMGGSGGAGSGGTGSGTGTGGGGTSDGDADGADCDPETGVCGGGMGSAGGGRGGGSTVGDAGATQDVAAALPTVLVAASGWSSTQTLAVVVVVLLVGLLVAPALLWRHLSRGDHAR